MKTLKNFAFLAIAAILLFGCVQQETKFVCPDGTTVSDKALCGTITVQTPSPTQASTATAIPLQATPTPSPTPSPKPSFEAPSSELKCFATSECYFAGSVCTSRFGSTQSDGKQPCENCVCNCVSGACTQIVKATPTPSPTPTPTPTEIGLKQVLAQNAKRTSVEISWHTDLNTTSHVSYGLAPNIFSNFFDDLKQTYEHWVPLGQLTHNKTYYFQVKSCTKDADGKENKCETSPTSTFNTPAFDPTPVP